MCAGVNQGYVQRPAEGPAVLGPGCSRRALDLGDGASFEISMLRSNRQLICPLPSRAPPIRAASAKILLSHYLSVGRSSTLGYTALCSISLLSRAATPGVRGHQTSPVAPHPIHGSRACRSVI